MNLPNGIGSRGNIRETVRAVSFGGCNLYHPSSSRLQVDLPAAHSWLAGISDPVAVDIVVLHSRDGLSCQSIPKVVVLCLSGRCSHIEDYAVAPPRWSGLRPAGS